MYIITINNGDYIIHYYKGNLVRTREYVGHSSNNIFLDNIKTNYGKGHKSNTSLLSLSHAKETFSSIREYRHEIFDLMIARTPLKRGCTVKY